MDIHRLYPGTQEVDAWLEGIWQQANAATCRVTQEDVPFHFMGPFQAMGAARFLRFEWEGQVFYGLFQPAMASPAPLAVHVPGYGAEISQHPEIAFEGFHVLHVQPMGYMSPQGANDALRGPQGHWPVLPNTLRTGARQGYRTFLTQCAVMVNHVLAMPQTLPGRVSFFGTSQGGGCSLLLGSLYSGRGARCVAADQPFLTHFTEAGLRGAYEIMQPAIQEVGEENAYRALGFVDTASHVHRLTMPVMVTSGGADTVCPPDTIEPLFHALLGTRAYMHTQGMAHGHNREFTLMAAAWLRMYG